MNWRRWHWLNDITLPLLTAILRLCWMWPWLQLIQRWLTPSYQGNLLSPWQIIGLLLGGMAMTRWVLGRSWSIARARAWIAGTGIGIIFGLLWWLFARAGYALWDVRWPIALGRTLSHWQVEVPPPLITLLAAAYLWLRGVLDGRLPPTHERVWGTFASGFLILALLLLVGSSDPNGLPAGTEQWMLAFFAVGMAALALSSLEVARQTGRGDAEKQPRLSRYWLVSVLSVIVALLGVGLLLSALVTPEAIARAFGWSSALLRILGMVLYYTVFAVAYVVFLVLTPLIHWLQSLVSSAPRNEPLQMPDFQKQLEEISRNPGPTLPPAVGETARWFGVIGLIVAIALAFALALRRFWGNEAEEVEETRELILSRDLLGEQLSALWRGWADRLRWAPRKALSPFLPLDGEPQTRRVIRALYQALLMAAKERGLPRLRGQTPVEYAQALSAAVPDSGEPLSVITQGYIQARYDLEPPSAERAEEVRRAWERLRATLEAWHDGTSPESDA